MNIYLACTLVGILAMFLTQIIVVGKQMQKYKLANLKWEWKVYWGSDFFVQVAGTIVTMGIGLILLTFFLQQYPKVKDLPFFVASFFAFVGYTGTDSATKFFSAINNRYNSAVDYKTTEYDKSTGNLDSPTPAAKPKQ
jgi:hypothetical protein